MPTVDASSADEAWLLAVELFRKEPGRPRQNGRGGRTYELLHVSLQIRNPRDRWVLSRSHPISVAFAIVEAIGIINGRNDSGYLNYFNPQLPKFAGMGAKYHGAYGFRLRENFGFDQLARACESLSSNPDGRQIVLQIWDPTKDFPHLSGAPVASDIPCNLCSMLKIRGGKLEWSQVMRSNDLFRGLPYNFVQFTTLQEVMAGWLGIEIGSYTHFSDSLHIYEGELKTILDSARVPSDSNADSLAFPKEVADPIWAEMNDRVNRLVSGGLSEHDYFEMATLEGAPKAFSNLMSIVVADAARRSSKMAAALRAAEKCSNPTLRLLWQRWLNSRTGKESTANTKT
ncbi:MAG TPA: thymidylate synthase [Alloacidobacterium sp.]|nr:thymidylate synthase [Alloacidobacterium sp.]